ncbi:MAG: hypothetical protein ABMA13_05810 [Chthoniobacteraceae bacterium]
MEETAPVDQLAPAEPAPAAPAPEIAPDPAALAELAERASVQRLPPPDEERAAQLLRAALLAGTDDSAALVALLIRLGWSATVKGVVAAWPDLKATAKTALLKSLTIDETEAGRRIRLSLARGMFKVPDIAASTRLIVGVCKDIRDKTTGEIPMRDAQNFASVLIGKGKPWIALIPLADLKPADAELLVHCAVIAAFTVGGPPVTPLGVLKWAADAGRLAELDPVAVASVAKAVARWSPKWAESLRNEVPTAPEPILAALKSAEPDAPKGAPDETDDEDLPDEQNETPSDDGDESRPKDRPVYVSKTIQPSEGRGSQQREPREPRGAQAKSAQFNAGDALRQLDAHIVWLKNELNAADRKARTRDDDRRQERKKPDVPIIAGEPTPEELARLNVQLEARIAELTVRIDDLTGDAEARATSAGIFSGEQPPPDTQLRTLLALKLTECYADFAALEQEDRDLVIPQHYRTVLAEVFEVLKAEGVPLAPPPAS